VVEVLVPLVLLAHGVTAGVMVGTAMGVVPMTRAQPYDRYVWTIQFLWPRYDPFMPIVNGLALVLGVTLAATAPGGAARALFALAAALLVVVMAISVLKNVPINRFVMALDPARRPADWAKLDPRARWRAWNLLRTGLHLLALGANLGATGALLAGGS